MGEKEKTPFLERSCTVKIPPQKNRCLRRKVNKIRLPLSRLPKSVIARTSAAGILTEEKTL